MDSKTTRQTFLDYFASQNHQVVRSSSIVPANDPTLYFTNAGMVQFKDVFVGEEKRDYVRASSSQKCLRVSGKHNDLENVGRTSRHHTFFEMLGNFSFGDYFKRDAIFYAWEFLTKHMQLEADRMVATVFGGEKDVPFDEESFNIWHQEIGLPEDRIFRLGKADNFWSMGDQGPCGPCSEIHYFQGDHLPCDRPVCQGVACECDRWIEIWNLVFMQFNRNAKGILDPLAAKGVDTGMGLERLVAIKQKVTSTYDTDLIRPLIAFAEQLSSKTYGKVPEDDVSLRVIADHARATAFCIADGVFPEKAGREYVLRRIMRRAIRHGKRLGFEEPFFHRVCKEVVRMMAEVYPELSERAEVIETIALAEETSFRRTLNRGLQKLEEAIVHANQKNQKELSVEFVGKLYDTDGFPIDLTRLIAEESGLHVDEEQAREWVAKAHGNAASKVGEEAVSPVYKALLQEHGPTDFLGYQALSSESEVLALVKRGELVSRAQEGEEVEVITRATPFYGRSGGQLGDTGQISSTNSLFEVSDTLKPGGKLFVHHGKISQGHLSVGEKVTLAVNEGRRQAIALNHSATHLLHHALRKVLGDHVAQKGSEVSPAQLRFDFSHFKPLTQEERERVELLVNAEIRRNIPSRIEVLDFNEAQKLGAMALFGEKYGDRVRVVHIGGDSIELCGGTHVHTSGEIGFFKIISEENLALGVRRIFALTGEEAINHFHQESKILSSACELLRCGPMQLLDRMHKLQAQIKEQEKQLEKLKHKLATGGGGQDLLSKARDIKGVKVLATQVDAPDPKTLREAGDALRDRLGSGILVLGGIHKDKVTLLVMVTPDLVKRYHAGKIVASLAEIVGGKGGGRPDMAQAGGPRVDNLGQALKHIETLI